MKRISFFEVMSPLLPLPVGLLPLPLQESFIQLIVTKKCSISNNQFPETKSSDTFTTNDLHLTEAMFVQGIYDDENKQAVK